MSRLAGLAQQRARLESKAAELRTRERTLARQSDARRKIVAGSVVLRAVVNDQRARDWFVGCLKKSVSDRDRHLFADLLDA